MRISDWSSDVCSSDLAVIRVNSQSGKGGVAWVLQQDKGLKLPKRMQADFSRIVPDLADQTSRELAAADIWTAFEGHYCLKPEQPFTLIDYQDSQSPHAGGNRLFVGKISLNGEASTVSGRGNGLITSVLEELRENCGIADRK